MAAIKPLLTRLLNAYLSPYIENLNSDDFSVPYLGGALLSPPPRSILIKQESSNFMVCI